MHGLFSATLSLSPPFSWPRKSENTCLLVERRTEKILCFLQGCVRHDLPSIVLAMLCIYLLNAAQCCASFMHEKYFCMQFPRSPCAMVHTSDYIMLKKTMHWFNCVDFCWPWAGISKTLPSLSRAEDIRNGASMLQHCKMEASGPFTAQVLHTLCHPCEAHMPSFAIKFHPFMCRK